MKTVVVRKQVNWNQVFYFSEIASCGSIKDASLRLGLSSSTLSEHIAQLEKDLDIQLFHRQHRKLTLTPEGSRLYFRAKEMFEAGQRLIDVVSPVPLGSSPVSIGLVPSPSIQMSYRLIGDFVEKHGPLNMKVIHARHADLEAGLARADFSLGFSDRAPERKDIGCLQISSSYVKFFVASRWSELKLLDLLERLPLLICNSEPAYRTLAEQSLTDAGFAIPAVVSSDYPSVLIDLCRRGLGVGVFGEEPIRQMNLESLKSFRVPRDAPMMQDNLYMLWADAAANTESVKSFMQLLPGGFG